MIQKKTGEKIFPFANQPLLFGHRGCSKIAPENTLAAFRGILDNNIPGTELDVHRCKSGELVVMHDFNTKRITGVDLVIEETELSVLRKLDAGSKFSENFQGELIPTLDEVLELLGSKVYYDIEIKHRNTTAGPLERDLLKKIQTHNLEDRVIISSFNPFAVRGMKKLAPYLPIAVIYAVSPAVPFIFRRGLGKYIAHPDILKPSKNQITEKLLKKAKKHNSRGIITWVVDKKEDAADLLTSGVGGIISNQPEILKKTVEKFYSQTK